MATLTAEQIAKLVEATQLFNNANAVLYFEGLGAEVRNKEVAESPFVFEFVF